MNKVSPSQSVYSIELFSIRQNRSSLVSSSPCFLWSPIVIYFFNLSIFAVSFSVNLFPSSICHLWLLKLINIPNVFSNSTKAFNEVQEHPNAQLLIEVFRFPKKPESIKFYINTGWMLSRYTNAHFGHGDYLNQ